MNKRLVSVELPDELAMAVHDLATEREDTVSQILQDLLAEHLAAKKGARPDSAPTSEKLVFALQKLLFRDMAEATSWEDLDHRMRKHGYYLKISWGGLALHTETSGHKVCHTHNLGFSYGTFVRRFGPGKPKDPREP
ncbi:MAG: hypothetical protein V2I76_12245 [Roseobacter sp.]|jgi:hypothetical protein|nr:hypothetical protein [Roseobacter sp.]